MFTLRETNVFRVSSELGEMMVAVVCYIREEASCCSIQTLDVPLWLALVRTPEK